MADFYTVSDNVIRVQLPGDSVYAPAFHQAAAKTGDRSDLPKRTTNAFNALIEAAVAVLTSGSSTEITLEMIVHESSIEATLVGTKCASPTKRSVATLASVAKKKSGSFEHKSTKSATTITFET